MNYFNLRGGKQRELDTYVAANTGFKTMYAMMTAKGGYTPTIDCTDEYRSFMADVYDDTMIAHGDKRRAFRTGSPAIKAERESNPDTNLDARIAAKQSHREGKLNAADAKRQGKLSDRVAQAKIDAKDAFKAPYKTATSMAIGHLDASGELGGEKDYIDRFTLKDVRDYIKRNHGEGFVYFVEGEIDGADNLSQYINRFNDYSPLCGQWDCEGWIDAREYWDIELTETEVEKLIN